MLLADAHVSINSSCKTDCSMHSSCLLQTPQLLTYGSLGSQHALVTAKPHLFLVKSNLCMTASCSAELDCCNCSSVSAVQNATRCCFRLQRTHVPIQHASCMYRHLDSGFANFSAAASIVLHERELPLLHWKEKHNSAAAVLLCRHSSGILCCRLCAGFERV